jgi:putative endopeptidase
MKKGIAIAILVCSGALLAQDAGKPAIGAWGVDLTGMDKTVKPGDSFFRYADGTWYDKAVIPSDRTSTGGFPDLAILSEKREIEIIDAIEAKSYNQLRSDEKQLRDLYDAFMDSGTVEKNGLVPTQKTLAAYAAINSLDGVARAMGDHSQEAGGLFTGAQAPNPKDSNAYIVSVSQSGLLMPDRDYYLRDDKALAANRDAFRTYLTTMFQLTAAPNAAARADKVFALETDIAKLHWPAADNRDVDKTYNPMTPTQLEAYAPQFPWRTFFTAENINLDGPKGPRTIVVRQNTAIQGMARLFASTDVAVWRDWLTIHYLHHIAGFLPKPFEEADFTFFGKVLAGQQQQLDRKKRAVALLDSKLGEELGKIYVEKYFSAEAKAKIEQLVSNLLKAYDADIRTLPWMTETTRQKALDKLHAFTPHVAYPDKWRDYSDLSIRREDLVGNINRSDMFQWQHRVDRIDLPVDRDEWSMTTPTVNAYYSGASNSIVFPAAILQPPFFDPHADDAVNYGGIGAVIGHEISHGFDDQGSKRDGAGNLNNWWTDADRKAFDERTTMFGAQYEKFEPLPGLHVNPKLTMGENIGDLSGVAIAIKAYHISLNGKTAPVLDGHTGDQRFFLAYAQIWRSKMRDAGLRRRILSDPHSPPEFRLIGVTRNIDAWYDAFDVKPGDKYYLAPDQRVRLW